MNAAERAKRTGPWRVILLGALLATAGPAAFGEDAVPATGGTAGAQETAAESEAAPWMPSEGRTAGQAIDALVDSANERYARAMKEKREGIELELLEDFEAFSKAWSGTDESILALIQSATLAGMADDFDRAERNLRQADELTDDPEFEAEIRRGLMAILVRPGVQAPEFALQTVDGRSISLADFKGKVLLLDFWATWCGPCIAELPNLKKVQAEFQPKGLEVVSISLDSEREYFDKFIKDQGMAWTHVYQEAQTEQPPIADRYGVVSIPRMILIGPDGKVIASQLRGERLREAVAEALGAGE